MKRILPLSILLLGAMAATAQSVPAVYPGGAFRCFSPDGKYAVSDAGDHSPLVILDFTTDKYYDYNEEYAGGSGNFISNTGIVVGSNMLNEKASYWKDGEWNYLKVPAAAVLSYANGITPDGKRIVGDFSPSSYSGDYEGIMVTPCYWELQADGTYEGPYSLPHPNLDYTNRTPQYITAVRVSDDGKIIAGQMKDYLGMVCQPIVYFEDENGEWTYELLLEDLFHPSGYELPEYPGDAPEPYDYMTADEIKKYEEAMANWELTGNDNYDTYPDIYEFMTPDEYAQFAEDALAWNEAYENFDIALWNLVSVVPNFTYNNVLMTSDGGIYATTDAKYFQDEVIGMVYKEFVPYSIDINTGDYHKYPAKDDIQIMLSSLIDDGTLLGQWNEADYGVYNGYILPTGEQEFFPLYDYVKKVDEKTAAWMAENMTHTYKKFNFETEKEEEVTIVATGIPFSTPDMSLVGFAQYSFWDYTNPYQYYGYLISLPSLAGVDEIMVDNNIDSTLRVYNLQGVKVLETKNASELNNLSRGIYIVNGKKVMITR